jgi:hypothetical protein
VSALSSGLVTGSGNVRSVRNDMGMKEFGAVKRGSSLQSFIMDCEGNLAGHTRFVSCAILLGGNEKIWESF